MVRYFIKRILLLIPVVIVVSFIVFTLMDLAPGDPLSEWDLTGMSSEEVAALRTELGLDDPMLVRYGKYLFRLLQGDLGLSNRSGISVWETFMTRLPNTLILAFTSFVIGVAVSIPMGVIAARRAGTITDNVTTGLTMVGMSMPGFWLGILLILLFADRLGWFPVSGYRDGPRSIVLPAVCSAAVLMATTTRQTRSSMLEVLKSDYLRTARAKGVPENVVIRKHALGNAMIPIVTTAGLGLGFAVSGTAVIEAVFAWPGIGRFIVESVNARDVTATTGAVILTTVLYVLVLLIVDMAYAIIDPRIKAQYSSSGRLFRKQKKTPEPQAPKRQIETLPQKATIDDRNAEKEEAQAVASLPEQTVITPAKAETSAAEAPAHFQKQSPAADDIVEVAEAAGDLVTRKYRKRSRVGEVFYRLRRNRGAIAGLGIISILIILFFASLFIPFDLVSEANVSDRFTPPGLQYLFGTDGLGRNQFTRVIYATRYSLPIGFGATALAAVIGTLLGAFAGFYGKFFDEIIMRFSDALASIPGILLGMVIITTLGRSLPNLIIAVGVTTISPFIRISRASILSIKGNEFVEAAKAIGLSNIRIIFGQILPNTLAPIIVSFTTSLGMAILISASLSFLGYGVPVPYPEWGSLISAGRDNIRNASWLTTIPGLFIMVTVMAFNLLGDGLRDAFDPKLKR